MRGRAALLRGALLLFRKSGALPLQNAQQRLAALEDLHVGSRILYYAESCDRFAEHELDYIIFARKEVTLEPNPDEIAAVKWVSFDQFEGFL